MELPMSGRIVAKSRYCDECQAIVDEEERQERQREADKAARWRQENIEELLRKAGVIKRYLRCSLENFEGPRPSGTPSYLWGSVGAGKTHLAVGFLREALLKRGREAGRFIRAVDLFKEIRDTFNEGSAESEMALLREYGAKVPLLVIDDLGTEKVTEWVEQTLYDLLDRRYGEELETIITSNLDPDRLADHYHNHGTRLVSRIAAMGVVFEVKGEDRRKIEAKRKKKGTTQA